jgi:deoxyribodipyrimidine photo-lyase
MTKSIFWHRRDLRIEDNAGLYKASTKSEAVQPVFIFDTQILSELEPNDARVEFIHEQIERLATEYKNLGVYLQVEIGNPTEIIPRLAAELNVDTVVTNRDYEPYALQRDKHIHDLLKAQGIEFIGAKDHVVFEKNEVVKADGLPYTVFTPYCRKWKEALSLHPIETYDSVASLRSVKGIAMEKPIPTLLQLGFTPSGIAFPTTRVEDLLIEKYSDQG